MRVVCAISSISALVVVPAAVADPPSPAPDPILAPLAPGQVVRIGPIAGTGTPTRDYGIGATDLCEFMEFPTELLQICGDSFAGQGVGFGGWYSPVALRVAGDSVDSPEAFATPVSSAWTSRCWPTRHHRRPRSCPPGVVQINRQNYLLVTTTKDLVPQTSRLVKAVAGQSAWQTVAGSQRPAAYAGGARLRSAATTTRFPRRIRRAAGCTS